MSLYTLLSASNKIGTLPPSPIIRPVPVSQQNTLPVLSGNVLDPNLAISPPENQSFQLTVKGTGAVSATAQVYGSNDKVNWVPYGAAITSSGTGTGTNAQGGTTPYAFFGALLTAITGTGATATLVMNA